MSYKTLKRLLLWERKQPKVGCQLPGATKMADVEDLPCKTEILDIKSVCNAPPEEVPAVADDEPVPSLLLPCTTCNRTFRPEALAKHVKVCEKSLIKKRKQFDSAKQRIQGTDLAQFITPPPHVSSTKQHSVKKRAWGGEHPASPAGARRVAKWREKPETSTGGGGGQLSAAAIKMAVAVTATNQMCPHCERYFGPKAFDRHVEWCKEQQTRVMTKSQACLVAKERLEARTKYRAPLNKTQRTLTKEKYSPVRQIRDPSPSIGRTLNPIKLQDTVTNTVSTSALSRSSPQRSSFKHVSPGRIPVIAPKNLSRSNSMRNPTTKFDSEAHHSPPQSTRETPSKQLPNLINKPKVMSKSSGTAEKRLESFLPVPAPRHISSRSTQLARKPVKVNSTSVLNDIEGLTVASCILHNSQERPLGIENVAWKTFNPSSIAEESEKSDEGEIQNIEEVNKMIGYGDICTNRDVKMQLDKTFTLDGEGSRLAEGWKDRVMDQLSSSINFKICDESLLAVKGNLAYNTTDSRLCYSKDCLDVEPFNLSCNSLTRWNEIPEKKLISGENDMWDICTNGGFTIQSDKTFVQHDESRSKLEDYKSRVTEQSFEDTSPKMFISDNSGYITKENETLEEVNGRVDNRKMNENVDFTGQFNETSILGNESSMKVKGQKTKVIGLLCNSINSIGSVIDESTLGLDESSTGKPGSSRCYSKDSLDVAADINFEGNITSIPEKGSLVTWSSLSQRRTPESQPELKTLDNYQLLIVNPPVCKKCLSEETVVLEQVDTDIGNHYDLSDNESNKSDHSINVINDLDNNFKNWPQSSCKIKENVVRKESMQVSENFNFNPDKHSDFKSRERNILLEMMQGDPELEPAPDHCNELEAHKTGRENFAGESTYLNCMSSVVPSINFNWELKGADTFSKCKPNDSCVPKAYKSKEKIELMCAEELKNVTPTTPGSSSDCASRRIVQDSSKSECSRVGFNGSESLNICDHVRKEFEVESASFKNANSVKPGLNFDCKLEEIENVSDNSDWGPISIDQTLYSCNTLEPIVKIEDRGANNIASMTISPYLISDCKANEKKFPEGNHLKPELSCNNFSDSEIDSIGEKNCVSKNVRCVSSDVPRFYSGWQFRQMKDISHMVPDSSECKPSITLQTFNLKAYDVGKIIEENCEEHSKNTCLPVHQSFSDCIILRNNNISEVVSNVSKLEQCEAAQQINSSNKIETINMSERAEVDLRDSENANNPNWELNKTGNVLENKSNNCEPKYNVIDDSNVLETYENQQNRENFSEESQNIQYVTSDKNDFLEIKVDDSKSNSSNATSANNFNMPEEVNGYESIEGGLEEILENANQTTPSNHLNFIPEKDNSSEIILLDSKSNDTVYSYSSNKQEWIEECDSKKENCEYSLTPKFYSNWSLNKSNSTEIIPCGSSQGITDHHSELVDPDTEVSENVYCEPVLGQSSYSSKTEEGNGFSEVPNDLVSVQNVTILTETCSFEPNTRIEVVQKASGESSAKTENGTSCSQYSSPDCELKGKGISPESEPYNCKWKHSIVLNHCHHNEQSLPHGKKFVPEENHSDVNCKILELSLSKSNIAVRNTIQNHTDGIIFKGAECEKSSSTSQNKENCFGRNSSQDAIVKTNDLENICEDSSKIANVCPRSAQIALVGCKGQERRKGPIKFSNLPRLNRKKVYHTPFSEPALGCSTNENIKSHIPPEANYSESDSDWSDFSSVCFRDSGSSRQNFEHREHSSTEEFTQYDTVEYIEERKTFHIVKTSVYSLPPLVRKRSSTRSSHFKSNSRKFTRSSPSHSDFSTNINCHRVVDERKPQRNPYSLRLPSLPCRLNSSHSSRWTSFPHVVRHIITAVLPKRLSLDDIEKYDPYVSAKLQMLELFSNDSDKQRNGSSSSPDVGSSVSSSGTPTNVKTPPTIPTNRVSPPSAFAKFLPISPEKPSPKVRDFSNSNENENNNDNENNNNNNNYKYEKVDNRRNMSLSNLSLCSVISLDSLDYNRSPIDLVKHGRKSEDRSGSGRDSAKSTRHATKSKLNMQQMLYGISPQNSPVEDKGHSPKDEEDLEACEAELLVSMLEFEKMLNTSPSLPSIQTSPPVLCSSSFPRHVSDFEGGAGDDEKMYTSAKDDTINVKLQHTSIQSSDSAYSSLTRKTPVDGLDSAPVKTEYSYSKFCHECGAKYPVAAAKFCCQCGIRRLNI